MADIERRETLPLLDVLVPKALAMFDFERYAPFGHGHTGPIDLMQASRSAVLEVAQERSLGTKAIFTELRSGSDIEQELLDDLIKINAPGTDPQSEEYFQVASGVIIERHIREHYSGVEIIPE